MGPVEWRASSFVLELPMPIWVLPEGWRDAIKLLSSRKGKICAKLVWQGDGWVRANVRTCWCVSFDDLPGKASEAEGAFSSIFAGRSHLPLRGKLGWMTPRSGVKTTPGTKRAFRGSRTQAGAPNFLSPLVARRVLPLVQLTFLVTGMCASRSTCATCVSFRREASYSKDS